MMGKHQLLRLFLSLSFNIDEFLGKRYLKPYTNMVKIVSVVGHKPTSIIYEGVMKTKKRTFSRRAVACFAILPFFLAACQNNQPVVEESSNPVAASSFKINRPEFTPESDKGQEADFTGAIPVTGSSIEVTYSQGGSFSSKDSEIPSYTASGKTSSSIDNTTCRVHKVHAENLEKGQAYSYKIGASSNYAYGAFIVEGENIEKITAVQMSDAQTKDADKHDVWRPAFFAMRKPMTSSPITKPHCLIWLRLETTREPLHIANIS